MTANVNEDTCISCGLCVQTCEDVFHWGDSGKAEAITSEVPDEYAEDAITCQESCPVDAITVS